MKALYLTHVVQQKESRMLTFLSGQALKLFLKTRTYTKLFCPLPLNSTKSMFSYRIGSPVTKASSSQPWGCNTLLCQLCYQHQFSAKENLAAESNSKSQWINATLQFSLAAYSAIPKPGGLQQKFIVSNFVGQLGRQFSLEHNG